MTHPRPRYVHVIVIVGVIEPVVVAALVDRNDAVSVIHSVDSRLR